jgi:homoserine kinase
LLAAEALAGAEIGRERIHHLASEIDGHPDNVAAALMGGFVVVGRDGGGVPRAERFDPPGVLEAALFIPAVPLRTAEMRAALPSQVAHADAAHNVGRTAMVVAALTADRPALLSAMADDRLHEPYRAAHFPQLPELVAAARSAGALGAALSGAGSTVIALCDDAGVAERVGSAMAETAARLGLEGRAAVVRPASDGARVIAAPEGA